LCFDTVVVVVVAAAAVVVVVAVVVVTGISSVIIRTVPIVVSRSASIPGLPVVAVPVIVAAGIAATSGHVIVRALNGSAGCSKATARESPLLTWVLLLLWYSVR